MIHELGHATTYQNGGDFRELRENNFGDVLLTVIDEGIAEYLQKDGLKYLIGDCARENEFIDGFLLSKSLFIQKIKNFVGDRIIGRFYRNFGGRGREMFLSKEKEFVSQAIRNPEELYRELR